MTKQQIDQSESAVKPPVADPAKAVAYLFGLPVNRITLTAIIPDGPTTTATFAKTTDSRMKAIKWIAEQQAAGKNIYYQDCSVSSIGKRPVKADVSLIHCAHADLDVKGDLSPEAHAKALAAILAVLEGYSIPPTDIICTGNGVQAFWYLDTPLIGSPENVEKIEAVNRALAADLGGDSCQDVAHLMRLPFTVNYPNKLKRSKGRVPARSYVIREDHATEFMLHRLDRLPSKSAESKQQTTVIDEADIPDAVDLSRLSATDRRTIRDGAAAGADRSAVVYAIACAMRRASYTDGEIIATIIDPENGISDHILDQKQRTPIAQAMRTIDRMNEKGIKLPDFDDGYEPPELSPEEEKQQSKLRQRIAREKAAKQEKMAQRRERVVRGLSIIRGSDIKIANLKYVWKYVLARGIHTVLAGEGGFSKSQVTYSIAAACTKGGKLPDGEKAPKGTVVILNAEDSTDTMFGPRLIAAGADMNKIVKVQAVITSADEKARKFSLQNDLEALKELCEDIGDVVLIIIDPASSYMGGTLDSRQNAQVRNVLDPISTLAEQLNVAVWSVSHYNKGTAAKAINRVIDSTAFVNAPRAVWGVFADPDDMENENRLFVQLKTNIAPPNIPGRSYKSKMKVVGNDPDDGKPIEAPYVQWGERTMMTGDQIVAEENQKTSPRTDEAVAFLREQIEGKDPPPFVDDVEQAARANGIAPSTLKTAKRKLGVNAMPPNEAGGPWRWSLPPARDLDLD